MPGNEFIVESRIKIPECPDPQLLYNFPFDASSECHSKFLSPGGWAGLAWSPPGLTLLTIVDVGSVKQIVGAPGELLMAFESKRKESIYSIRSEFRFSKFTQESYKFI